MDDHIQMSTAAEKGIVALLYIHNCCCVYAKQTASFAWKIDQTQTECNYDASAF